MLTCRTVAADFDQSHALLDGVLKRHVKSARVDYASLKAHPEELNRYLDQVAAVGATQRALITGNPFPQAPKWTWNVTARLSLPVGGNGGELYAFTDWAGQGRTNLFLYEAAEFFTSGNVEGGLRLGYLSQDGKLDFALFARNILDAENVKGAIDFNNLTGFVNEPRIVGVSASLNF